MMEPECKQAYLSIRNCRRHARYGSESTCLAKPVDMSVRVCYILSTNPIYRSLGLEDRIRRSVFGRDGRARLAFTHERPLSRIMVSTYHFPNRYQTSQSRRLLAHRSATLNAPHVPTSPADTHCSPSGTAPIHPRPYPGPPAADRKPSEHVLGEKTVACGLGLDGGGEAGRFVAAVPAGSRPPLGKVEPAAAADDA